MNVFAYKNKKKTLEKTSKMEEKSGLICYSIGRRVENEQHFITSALSSLSILEFFNKLGIIFFPNFLNFTFYGHF